jgi:gas vesicle protein
MSESVEKLKLILSELITDIESLKIDNAPFINRGEYYYPAFSISDLWNIMVELSRDADKLDGINLSEGDEVYLNNVCIMLAANKPSLRHIKDTNYSVSSPAILGFTTTLLMASFYVGKVLSFDKLTDKELLPKNIIRRLNLYKDNLKKIESETVSIEDKISVITDAYEAAEDLPTSLRTLKEANAEVVALKESSSTFHHEIEKHKKDSEISNAKSKEFESEIKECVGKVKEEARIYLEKLSEEAKGYIDKCEEAFRTTTSKGLAGAFEDKAKKLNRSIQLWVGGLALALLSGSIVGYYRLETLGLYLADANASFFKIATQIVMSIMSIGAPLWFAWLSTKQIGQRFRLAEDYEFKASVSKAYEGYRREAVALDGDFASRLFGNALTRLEEAPLRFVEEQTHSSPIMEMLNSNGFKKFVDDSGSSIDSVLRKSGLRRDEKKSESKKIKPAEEIDVGEVKQEE